VETGYDAMAGEIPPAADESGLGIHPDADDGTRSESDAI
jgi:hypothetical protein